MRHGFLLVDKPTDFTSHDAIAVVRKTLPERAIGHLGTLDPAATGLLVAAVGRKALKVVELFGDLSKEYEAEVTLGSISSTYDREGVIEESMPMGWNPPELSSFQRMIDQRFTGMIEQVPPAHSAIKISGERAYHKARQGRVVDMPSRTVQIEKCEILSYEHPRLNLRVRCGSGTYIRSLAHDIGQLLRCGAYLSALRRTKVGEWSVENAKAPAEVGWTDVMPLKDVLVGLPRRDLTTDEYEDLQHGQNIEAEVVKNTIGWHDELPVAILIPAADGTAHARKVF